MKYRDLAASTARIRLHVAPGQGWSWCVAQRRRCVV